MAYIYEVYFVVTKTPLERDESLPIYKFQRDSILPLDPNELIEIIGSLSGRVMALTGYRCQILNHDGYTAICGMDADIARAPIELIE